MPNYPEIVRLHESSASQRSISQMLGTNRNIVSKVIKLVTAHQSSYQELAKWETQKMEAHSDHRNQRINAKSILHCRL